MGFFSGLIMFVAVVALIFVAALVGFIGGVIVTGYVAEKEYPESFEIFKENVKEEKRRREEA